jgi:prolyl oligopeptidase
MEEHTHSAPATAPTYPATRRTSDVDLIHGVAVADPYRWLEDPSSTAVRRWTADQDALSRAVLARLPRRQALEARLRELSYVQSAGTPHRFGSRLFYPRREASKEKTAVYFCDEQGAEHVLLDPNDWSADGSTSLGVWSPSRDGTKVAYTVKRNNSDEATLHVLDVSTGKNSDVDVIEGAKYAWPSWTPSGEGFFYTWLPPVGSVPDSERPGGAEVRFHRLATDPRQDVVVHDRTGDPKIFLSAAVDRSGRWLVATLEHGWTRTDVYYEDLLERAPKWLPLFVGKDARYEVNVDGNRFFVWTNDGAPNGRVLRVDPAHPEPRYWRELVAERKDAILQGLTVVGHHLALSYLKDIATVLELREEDGRRAREISLPGLGSASPLEGEVDDDVAFYSFQSFTYPTEIFRTSVATGRTTSWYKLHVPVDPSKTSVEQHFATSRDGTRIPFFVVAPQGGDRVGPRPAILYGYGGFQWAQTPHFSASIYPWLEQGGIWIVANLRGGSEYGEEWHRHGMLHDKQNVFDDYFAVAEELVSRGLTDPSKLVAMGASNGGLLVAAAVTQRPELFRVALCGVPLVDMIRYERFGSGKTWVGEFGTVDNPDDFTALYAYSPYHHVRPETRYPATLVLSADSDDRVDPMHARKFVAELQWASTGGPVLLRVEKQSGHGGADLVRALVARITDEYAFALDLTSATPP